MLHVIFFEPRIPGNTGAAIRLSANTGSMLHLFAFTSHTERLYTQVDWRGDDALLFGPEPTGLPQEILDHPRVSAHLRIPMVEGNRSLNLANSAAIGLYEAWRSLGFAGGA